MKKPFTGVAIALLAIIALVQLIRFAMGWEVSIGGVSIPLWVSVIAFIVTGGLAFLVSREARK
jgi:hypothetical protein